MTKDTVKTHITLNTPFSDLELKSDDVLKTIIDRALRDMNSFLPKVTKSMAADSYTDKTVLLSVLDNISDTVDPFKGPIALSVTSEKWTLLNIDESPNLPKFLELIEAHAYIILGNNRRSASMNGLPFDIKGDQFNREGQDMRRSVLGEIYDTMGGYF